MIRRQRWWRHSHLLTNRLYRPPVGVGWEEKGDANELRKILKLTHKTVGNFLKQNYFNSFIFVRKFSLFEATTRNDRLLGMKSR